MNETENVLKNLYTTVFSQKFSPDGDLKINFNKMI